MTGNDIGDEGAIILSKILQVSTTLKSLDLKRVDNEKRGEGKGKIRNIKTGLQSIRLEMKEQKQWVKCWRQTPH